MGDEAPDFVGEEIAYFMQKYNPPLRSQDPTASPTSRKLAPPITFYDKHLDNRFSLKKVEVIPLAIHLSRAVNETIQSIKDRAVALPPPTGGFFPSREFRKYHGSNLKITDSEAVAKVYQATAASYCQVMASTLLLHPNASCWLSALHWRELRIGSRDQSKAFTDEYGLEVGDFDQDYEVPHEVQEAMDKSTKDLLRDVRRRHPALAYWDIFFVSQEAENLLKNMGDAAGMFCHQQCRTSGYTAPPCVPVSTVDATLAPWEEDSTSSASTPSLHHDHPSTPPGPSDVHDSSQGSKAARVGGSSRSGGKPEDAKKTGEAAAKLDQPRTAGDLWPRVTLRRRELSRPMHELFLQRAWSRAVENDTTFIIFHCGNFERIGYRRRAEQTLYLSDLIDVPNCDRPAYGHLNTGLYLSIIQDVIDRTKQRQREEVPDSKTRKRRRKMDAVSSNKRCKTRAAVRKERTEAEQRRENYEIVKEHAASRSLALLEIRYGVYNSPAPASFVRSKTKKRKSYGPDEYFSLVLTSEIASGATGIAHEAQLKVLVGGSTRSLGVVVKLSFKLEQLERLRHEVSIYEHLAARGVREGIPFVFGLFEDTETDTLALVMSHVGECLWTLWPDPCAYKDKVSESAKASYLRVLGEIHRAGVRHRDIRPENLMLVDEDQVAIIDFDQAELNPTEGAKRREMRHITYLLDGIYFPPGEFPSDKTTPERKSAARTLAVLDSVDEASDEDRGGGDDHADPEEGNPKDEGD
ncbi:hypothetical protein LshimejAT787_1300900 [Lyophyllum shimeji]|uniref:Protein kinase domain-containing protein n=1 Tax=Lyophyllum shimeji TaxID=47721 RepID=A0A9P3PX39_LYOSH|nr:hypothetical protein LshimejAT787_1300900 [Lyophyllum shimeji]